jgi:hypothetical protein
MPLLGDRKRPYRPRLSPEAEAKVNARLPSHLNKEAFVNELVLKSVDSYAIIKTNNKRNNKNLVPKPLIELKPLIDSYWVVKPGSKSKQAWALLCGHKGVLGVKDKYGFDVAKAQLELAIANKWKSITLSNYEQFGLPRVIKRQEKELDFEAMDNAPSLY